MAQFRTSADILDSVLLRSGEVTNGNSAFENRVLEMVNRVHRSIVIGGHELNTTIDETWSWALAPEPIILELQPKYSTGTLTLTNGSEAGTLSDAPSYSLAGWHVQIVGRSGVFKIASHTASSTSLDLDAAYDGESGTLNFKAFKLDYELTPSYIIINEYSNKLDFKTSSGGSELTATLTAGSYTPSDLATHVAAQMTTAAAGPTITGSYSNITRKFTFTSDGAGSTTLLPLFATGSNQEISAHKKLGFDDTDISGALSIISTYIQGGIGKLVEPFVIHKNSTSYYEGEDSNLYGLDPIAFKKNYPLNSIYEGYPTRFCKISETDDGRITVRFDKYPKDTTRIEVPYVPIPRDIKDNAGSIPVIPRKHVDVLEFAAAYEILLEKEDSKAEMYLAKASAKLDAMVKQNRNELQRLGKYYAQIIPREDKTYQHRRHRYGYTAGGS